MASTKRLLDPELLPMTEETLELTDEQIRVARKMALEMPLGDAEGRGVSREEIFVAGDGVPDVRCLLYQPTADPQRPRRSMIATLPWPGCMRVLLN